MEGRRPMKCAEKVKMTQAVAEENELRSNDPKGKRGVRWKGIRLWCYQCRECTFWHMTSSPPRRDRPSAGRSAHV